ncbi:hypothetical protein [Myceligenerans salitolerans]|uniref:DUF222 domain-containing protein n=1 Tax=Myceligenerans salitolerans TaxID=1230528 RepID=A0ABS3IAB0_9MICO|nr:hypothetical protein [Myceligenerans salitolerans]MBO0609894.1 hypothetical protein [Myceligenerans salitolerans]
MSDARPTDPLSAILQASADLISTTLEQIEWAEDEIDAAIRRHPDQSDLLYHGFGLLIPTHRLMATEFVSRSHYRELLDRLATGQDTRPGTAAEVCCACCEASLATPLSSPAAGLYFRMWEAAFPDMPPASDLTQHHEALEGSSIDALEATSRRTLARKDRVVGEISCSGMHHGEPVPCAYAATGTKASCLTERTQRPLPDPAPAQHPAALAVDGTPAFLFELPDEPSPDGLEL